MALFVPFLGFLCGSSSEGPKQHRCTLPSKQGYIGPISANRYQFTTSGRQRADIDIRDYILIKLNFIGFIKYFQLYFNVFLWIYTNKHFPTHFIFMRFLYILPTSYRYLKNFPISAGYWSNKGKPISVRIQFIQINIFLSFHFLTVSVYTIDIPPISSKFSYIGGMSVK